MVLELAGGVRRAAKTVAHGSVAKLVTRNARCLAQRGRTAANKTKKSGCAAELVCHAASAVGDRRPCGSQESLAARKDDCLRQKEIERGGFQAQAYV